MSRKYGNNPGMGNNHEQNKMFENAARAAGLTSGQKIKFSELLHSEKEFETGDKTYDELLSMAYEIKSRYPNL